MTETKQTEQKDRDENGQFLPGNSLWRLGAWKPGNEGRPNLYTPIEFKDIVVQYVQDRKAIKKTTTMSGLRVYLGLSASGLRAYEQGEIGKTDQDKEDYIYILDQFRGYMEDEAESKLDRERGSTHGIEFRLKNIVPSNWKDSKHISVDTKERRTIKIIADPNSNWGKRLLEYGADVQVIEHTEEDGDQVSN